MFGVESLVPDDTHLLLIPVLIFLARVIDVSIGTLRILFVAKGLKYWAALLGFLESFIWILAIGQVMQNLGSWQTYVAFAAGFAAGNYVGIALEERIAMGNLIIRVITRHDASKLVRHLRHCGYGVTSLDAQGESGQVKVIFTLIKRRQLEAITKSIKKYSPNAFYSIEDVRFAKETYYPPQSILAQKPAVELRPRK